MTNLLQESLFDAFDEMGMNTGGLKNETMKMKLNKKPSQLSIPKQRALYIDHLKMKT